MREGGERKERRERERERERERGREAGRKMPQTRQKLVAKEAAYRQD